MARRLEGKIAVVAGDAGGVGLATAKQFGTEGALVFGAPLTAETIAKVRAWIVAGAAHN